MCCRSLFMRWCPAFNLFNCSEYPSAMQNNCCCCLALTRVPSPFVHGSAQCSAPKRPKRADPVDHLGRTPLHDAAWWGQKHTTEALLRGGAKVNARDCQG